MEPTSLSVVNLPKLRPDEFHKDASIGIAQRYRHLRLNALRISPQAFASTYEEEAQRDLGQTLERLANPEADHFVLVADPVAPWSTGSHERFLEAISSTPWFGMIVLIGPLTQGAVSAKQDPLTRARKQSTVKVKQAESGELLYHLNGVFVHPSARRAGLGKALIEAALRKGQAVANKGSLEFHCSILVDSGNFAARKLYEKAGFRIVGEEKYVQLPRSQMRESSAVERLALRMEVAWPVRK